MIHSDYQIQGSWHAFVNVDFYIVWVPEVKGRTCWTFVLLGSSAGVWKTPGIREAECSSRGLINIIS